MTPEEKAALEKKIYSAWEKCKGNLTQQALADECNTTATRISDTLTKYFEMSLGERNKIINS